MESLRQNRIGTLPCLAASLLMNIAPPRRPNSHPDRLIDCQEAIESAFQDLMENVTAAGWGPEEVAASIKQLAWAYLRTLEENAKTEAVIEWAKRLN